jgi:hypothetical protein
MIAVFFSSDRERPSQDHVCKKCTSCSRYSSFATWYRTAGGQNGCEWREARSNEKKNMVLKNHEKNHGFILHSQGMQVTSLSEFFKTMVFQGHMMKKP